MLQIVPMPVQESESTPGPWYSMIAPVPPLTVRIPATLRMMSAVTRQYSVFESFLDRRYVRVLLPLGEVQPDK